MFQLSDENRQKRKAAAERQSSASWRLQTQLSQIIVEYIVIYVRYSVIYVRYIVIYVKIFCGTYIVKRIFLSGKID